MNAQEFFFYLFSFLTLACGLLVVANPFRNPVNNAMFLVLTIISLAGLFVLLHAYFLAAVQILVYAGAVIVLFLFVIMLLDLKEEQRRRVSLPMVALAVIVSGVIALTFIWTLWKTNLSAGMEPATVEGSAATLGHILFGKFVLPFEILSLVLLVGMIGTILLSKKELK